MFFFKVPAPPEIYTYGLTLPLTVALPIFARGDDPLDIYRREAGGIVILGAEDGLDRLVGGVRARRDAAGIGEVRRGRVHPHELRGHRSEEHTSELQSLMRISYAVFCLKKKKNIITTKRKSIRQANE